MAETYKVAPLTGKAFRLSKQAKRLCALGKFKDAHDRGAYRRAMVVAEYTAQQAVKSTGRRNAAPGQE
jgi:hypothetical protein